VALTRVGAPARICEDEAAARVFLEQLRWPRGPRCPACGAIGSTRLSATLHQCHGCRKQFTLTAGTIISSSHIPLHKWLRALNLACTQREGVTAAGLRRDLELGSYPTAWMMSHRIRWAMTRPPLAGLLGRSGLTPARRPLRIALPFKTVVQALFEVRPEARTKPKGDRMLGSKAAGERKRKPSPG
jgi:transposase-like protein